MTIAQMIGALILAVAVVISIITFKIIKPEKEALMGMIMLICFIASISYAFFRTGELADEKRERAGKCIDEGYGISLAGHEIFSENIDLKDFIVTDISNSRRLVYLDYTPSSPEWSRFGE